MPKWNEIQCESKRMNETPEEEKKTTTAHNTSATRQQQTLSACAHEQSYFCICSKCCCCWSMIYSVILSCTFFFVHCFLIFFDRPTGESVYHFMRLRSLDLSQKKKTNRCSNYCQEIKKTRNVHLSFFFHIHDIISALLSLVTLLNNYRLPVCIFPSNFVFCPFLD